MATPWRECQRDLSGFAIKQHQKLEDPTSNEGRSTTIAKFNLLNYNPLLALNLICFCHTQCDFLVLCMMRHQYSLLLPITCSPQHVDDFLSLSLSHYKNWNLCQRFDTRIILTISMITEITLRFLMTDPLIVLYFSEIWVWNTDTPITILYCNNTIQYNTIPSFVRQPV